MWWIPPPWIFAFPSEFFENISHGYVFGVKESNGDKQNLHCMTLKIKVKHLFAWPFLSPIVIWYEVDLGVDSNIFEVLDIKYVKKNHVTLTVDLET